MLGNLSLNSDREARFLYLDRIFLGYIFYANVLMSFVAFLDPFRLLLK